MPLNTTADYRPLIPRLLSLEKQPDGLVLAMKEEDLGRERSRLHDKVRILSIPELDMKTPTPGRRDVGQNSQKPGPLFGATVYIYNAHLFVNWHRSGPSLTF